MTPSESLFSNTWNDASEQDAVYTKPSIWAIVAFLFGLASFLVFFTIWLAFFGILGIIFSSIALLLIKRSGGALSGLKIAQCGLAFSVISLVAVSCLWPTYHHGVRNEADRFFRIWFTALRENNIPLAKSLSSAYWSRPSTENIEKWWKDQYENRFSHRDIHNYVDNGLVRTLLALGDRASVSFYKTLTVYTGDEKDTVINVYAVSYPVEGGKTETFFVKMIGERMYPDRDVKSAGWLLAKQPELFVPDELKSSAKSPGSVQLSQ